MVKFSKKLAAFGICMTMLMPVMAVAASGEGGLSDVAAQKKLAADNAPTQSLDKVKGNLSAVGQASGIETKRSLPTIIGGIINVFLTILGVVLVVIIIYAGYKWMTAQGNSQQVDEAKKMISQAVIGMIIIFAAYAITNFVLEAVLPATPAATPAPATP